MTDSKKPLDFEAEQLTGLTVDNAVKETEVELWDFVSTRWQWSEETQEYQANGRKERRERAIFNGLYQQVRAIMASDKNGVFETPGELFDIARADEESFNKLYEAAVKVNPSLKKKEIKVEENPN
jgi:xanthine dehydrogenase molybdopterin-binding subunit B